MTLSTKIATLLLALGAAACVTTRPIVPPKPEEQPPTPEEAVRDLAAAINEHPPIVQGDMRLDGAEFAPGLVLQFNYTLLSLPMADPPDNVSLQILWALRHDALASFCESDEMKRLRELGGTLRYRYSDRDAQPLGAVEVSSRDCIPLMGGAPCAWADRDHSDQALRALAEQTRSVGKDSFIPSGLSHRLGIVFEPERVDVKQVTSEDEGHGITEAFNVPVGVKYDVIVLYTVDRERAEMRLYLTSCAGRLINAVTSRKDNSVKGGLVVSALSEGTLDMQETLSAFETKRSYWTVRAKEMGVAVSH